MSPATHRHSGPARHLLMGLTMGIISALVFLVATLAVPLCATAVTPGQPITSGFPRVGAIWPNPLLQPASELARFDYVAVQSPYASKAVELKAQNPDLMVLTATNACDVTIDPSAPATSTVNDAIGKVPNEWIQTQVGTWLSVDAAAGDQELQVVNASVFRQGDILVIENELAKVVAVGPNWVSVVRGILPNAKPAVAHAKGTRVAAAVVFWPGSVVMDLSGDCPKMQVDGITQTWAEYNARASLALLEPPGLDGLHIDRTNANAYVNNVFTRSIDPTRRNVPVTDGYAALNTSWNAGLRYYESLVRAGAPDAIILGNNAAPNSDLLNGTVLENIPRAGKPTSDWLMRTFGPFGGRSYFEFMRNAQQPNLTTFETYEVEESPIGGTNPPNPFVDPAWSPNYRKMRFGLCTALLNDGFYNYNIGTFGHASLGLMWFDEYDNGDRGNGYLGLPTAAATRAIGPVASADLLKGDGVFSTSSQFARWYQWAASGYALSVTRVNNLARLSITKSRGALYGATYAHVHVPVSKGQYYTLTFRAKASGTVSIKPGIALVTSPYTSFASFAPTTLSTSWKTYTVVTKATGSSSAAGLSFSVGGKVTTIYLDDVKLQKGWRPEAYRRDFQYGISLVNPELDQVSIALGGTYKRLTASNRKFSDPVTNNGAYVTSATLAAQDGLILLRTSPLTISASKTIYYGKSTGLPGALRSVEGTPLPGRRVVLYFSIDNKTWKQVAETTTTPSGTYSFVVVPYRTTYYKTRFFSDDENLDGFSSVTKVSVRASVSVPKAPTTMYRTRSYSVFGYLKPRHNAGSYPVRIYKYRYVSGTWKSYGYVNARAYNYYSYTKYVASVRLPYAGKWRLRAYHADSGHAATWSSGYDYVTVR